MGNRWKLAGALLAALGANAPDSAAQELRRAPGTAFRDCAVCPEMVIVPAGRFAMGQSHGDSSAEAWERPARPVAIGAFALGKYEVTFEEWDACVAEGGCSERLDDKGWGRGRRPAIGPSWNDAKGFAAWLSRKTRKAYRLPSEAEWEYAARAGAATRFPWGEEAGRGHANCHDCITPRIERTAPVGSYSANAFGLHDMIGNTWEWTEDCWHDSHAGAPGDGRPRLDGQCLGRVVRGGSWVEQARSIRVSARTLLPAGFRGGPGYIGFRVARADE